MKNDFGGLLVTGGGCNICPTSKLAVRHFKLDLEKKMRIFHKARKLAKIDTKFKGSFVVNMHEI